MPNAGDVVVIDFPGVQGLKRRPAVVLSSAVHHASRPDVVVGLLTSRAVAAGPTDHVLHDWAEAGLRVPSDVEVLKHGHDARSSPGTMSAQHEWMVTK